ncbi:MAG: glucose-1-phosphate adenylyltransferase subunit GlgD, partial [Clostridia bacterium]|nr:glucose-1-phosphate adenylyltransferase subunit GlgD [Clostridia bacterium]
RFYDVSLMLLDSEVRKSLFSDAQVYTKIKDSAPTEYGANAVITNSLVSDGCQIEGEVHNSILARGVKVGRGAVVRNCVLMKNTIVGDNSSINAVITDKNVVIRDRLVLSGCSDLPFYIKKDVSI